MAEFSSDAANWVLAKLLLDDEAPCAHALEALQAVALLFADLTVPERSKSLSPKWRAASALKQYSMEAAPGVLKRLWKLEDDLDKEFPSWLSW